MQNIGRFWNPSENHYKSRPGDYKKALGRERLTVNKKGGRGCNKNKITGRGKNEKKLHIVR